MEGELLSVPVAAELIGMPRTTFWRRVQAGEMPATKVGKTWVVQRSDVMRLAGQLKGKQGVRRPKPAPAD